MTKLLSYLQIAHLRALEKDGERSSYPGLKLGTLTSLHKRGLVRSRNDGPGAMWSPQTVIKFSLSEAGRQYLKNGGKPL